MSRDKLKPVSRKSEIVIQEFNNEILIYDLTNHKAFSLNETSAMIWQACDGKQTVSEISDNVSRKLKSPVNEDFVWLALEQLKKENLIENQQEISTQLEGVSRREMIRKVGLATLVTLPFVTSLVAPQAANAQSACGAASGRPNGCNCTSSTPQCASGCCGATGAGAANQFCVTSGSDGIGSYCRAGCECSTNCCVGNTCTSNTGGIGSACATGCQCAAGCCANGLCANDTVASGGACTLSCQCIGGSSCIGNVCT